jgi:ATP-binding protein involved in chromosome partitioning
VRVILAPSTAKEDVVQQLEAAVREAVESMDGLPGPVTVALSEPPAAPHAPRGPQPVPGVANVVAVASGKGGVGKSTVATNLALALATLRPNVGLMDADVYGPSVPLMLGIDEKMRAGEGGRLTPIERHGIKAVSMGMFVTDTTPIIWRGPMLTKLVTEFLRNCEWGELDVLVMDLPPGTGDVQLTLAQQLRMNGGVIVTTPQEVALADVRRGVRMFDQVKVPVVGLIENMSGHVCRQCGHEIDVFGTGGGERMAEELGIPFLGRIGLVGAVAEAGDAGTPIVEADPDDPVTQQFRQIASQIARTA